MISFDKVTWQVGSYPAQCGKIYHLHLDVVAVFFLVVVVVVIVVGGVAAHQHFVAVIILLLVKQS